MGLYNSSTLSVEAILTTRGKELLSTDGTVNITKFALGDEEIDYTLYDETHPNGTDSFGVVLENTIPLETSPTRQNLKSYLLNEGFSNKKLVVPQSTTLEADTAFLIKPVTNVDGKVHNETYLFAIDNTKIVSLMSMQGMHVKNVGKTFSGKQAAVRGNRINPGATTLITVTGLDTRLKEVIVVTVNADSTNKTLSPFDETAVVTDAKYY
jgi:hypothetical protein